VAMDGRFLLRFNEKRRHASRAAKWSKIGSIGPFEPTIDNTDAAPQPQDLRLSRSVNVRRYV